MAPVLPIHTCMYVYTVTEPTGMNCFTVYVCSASCVVCGWVCVCNVISPVVANFHFKGMLFMNFGHGSIEADCGISLACRHTNRCSN